VTPGLAGFPPATGSTKDLTALRDAGLLVLINQKRPPAYNAIHSGL
jgi:hypothetical protein